MERKPSKFDPNKAPDRSDFASKSTNPIFLTIELPLISDVWGGSEQIDAPPRIVLWLSGMDFSKAYNWRLATLASAVTTTGFTLTIGPWGDTILDKADVCWIAHADVPGIQKTFSTEDVRGNGWQLETSGFAKFEEKFGERKVPRFVAGLNKVEYGCGRDLKVETTTEVRVEGVKWRLNNAGDAHPYVMARMGATVWVRNTY